MKKIWYLSFLIGCCMLWSCGGDDDDPNLPDPDPDPIITPNDPVADPEGTITSNISESTSITIYDNFGVNCGVIKWTGPDNFYLYTNSASSVSICDMGTMKGLGNISSAPSSGYTAPTSSNKTVACETGHGYVVKFEGNSLFAPVYVRLYVDETIISTSGGIMGAKVKYHVFPFKATTLTLSAVSLNFGVTGGTKSITITTDAPDWDYICEEAWITPSVSGNQLAISVSANEGFTERTGEIFITANEKSETITIVQEPFVFSNTSAPYKIGDLYYKDGVVGIVYKINSNGNSGMIVSLGETSCQWSTELVLVGCDDLDDGQKNMNAIKQMQHWEFRYPAAKWCDDLNTGTITGWYLPSKNELAGLYAGFCGLDTYPGNESDASTVYRGARNKFNEILVKSGGISMTENVYWSSSEGNYYSTWEQNFGVGNQRYQYYLLQKNYTYRVRAVRAF